MTKGTNPVYGLPSNNSPARRTNVIMVNARDAVTGPRSNHLNNRLFTTRSGHDTPKNATAYAINTTSTATNKLMMKATLQNNNGNSAATCEPNNKYGYEPSAGAVAPAIRYNIRRCPDRVNIF